MARVYKHVCVLMARVCVSAFVCVLVRLVHSISGCRESLVPLESWNWRGCVEMNVEEHSCLGLLCTASPSPHPPTIITSSSSSSLPTSVSISLSFFLSHTHTFNCSLLITLSHSIQNISLCSLVSVSPFCLLPVFLFELHTSGLGLPFHTCSSTQEIDHVRGDLIWSPKLQPICQAINWSMWVEVQIKSH